MTTPKYTLKVELWDGDTRIDVAWVEVEKAHTYAAWRLAVYTIGQELSDMIQAYVEVPHE